MNTTMAQAVSAKESLKKILRTAGVEASCGITKVGGSYAVKVNLPTEVPRFTMPDEVEGIPVAVQVIGHVKILAKPRQPA